MPARVRNLDWTISSAGQVRGLGVYWERTLPVGRKEKDPILLERHLDNIYQVAKRVLGRVIHSKLLHCNKKFRYSILRYD